MIFDVIKKMFIGLLTGTVRWSNQTKFISLNNLKYMSQPTLINLHPNEYSQERHYYQFDLKLDTCAQSCNALKGVSNKICVPN